MKNKYFKLDGDDKIEPVENVIEWARWFESFDNRIEKTEIGDVLVSTVFLGMNHNWGEGPPLIYETLVFAGDLDGEMERYATEEEAREGHQKMVERVENEQG